MHIPRVPGPRVPPNHINYYTPGRGGLDLSFGTIEFICSSLKMQRKLYIPRVPGPRVPQTLLITILLGLVAKIIIWENWICLRIIENTREIVYPKGPGPIGRPNHINYYTLGIGGQDYHLGEFDLFVYHWNCAEHCISQRSRDARSPKPY